MKEFTEFRTELNEGVEDLVEHVTMPPNILILRRRTVRQFPDGVYVALYYNDKLGLQFSIPYGAATEPIVTPVALKETEELKEISIPVANRAYHERQKRGTEALKKSDYKTASGHFKKAMKTVDLRAKKYDIEDRGGLVKESEHLTEVEQDTPEELKRHAEIAALWQKRKKKLGEKQPTEKKLEEGLGLPVRGYISPERRRHLWMREFENHVVKTHPHLAGKIDWNTAAHLHNTGHKPEGAAHWYTASKPLKETVKKLTEDHPEEESEHGLVQRLRNITDFHAIHHITHADGSRTHVDPTTAHALLTVHDSLHPDNQKKFVQHLEHSKAKFHKMLDFTWKSVK